MSKKKPTKLPLSTGQRNIRGNDVTVPKTRHKTKEEMDHFKNLGEPKVEEVNKPATLPMSDWRTMPEVVSVPEPVANYLKGLEKFMDRVYLGYVNAPYSSTTPTTTMWAFPKEKK